MSDFYKTFPPLFNNTVIVRSWQDLQDLQDGMVYYIDGLIDMQGNSLVLPSGSGQVQFYGFSANSTGLYDSTDNYTMITGEGQFIANGLKFTTSGNNSKVIDIQAGNSFNACEFTNVNFEDCTSIGEICAYRQGLMLNCAFFGCADGLTFSGAWGGGFKVSDFIVRTFDVGDTGGTVFKAGTGLVFDSRFASDANIQVNGSSTAYSFAPTNFTNDQDFQLIGGELSGTGNYISGIDVTSVKSLWNSVGISATFPGAKMELTSESTTTVSASSTKYKLAGTFTYSDEIWVNTSTQNRFVYIGSASINFRVIGSLSLSSGNNKQLKAGYRVFNSSDVLQSEKFFSITSNGNGRAESVAIIDTVTLNENDYVELWASNESDTSNITLLLGSNLLIEQRKSI